MNNYHVSCVRYERLGKTVKPILVRKEWMNKKFTVVRLTEIPFSKPESHYLSSAELDNWGSCTVPGSQINPPNREELVSKGYIKPSDLGSNLAFLALDWRGWDSHARDRARILSGFEPELPAAIQQVCDCGVCNECADREHYTFRANIEALTSA